MNNLIDGTSPLSSTIAAVNDLNNIVDNPTYIEWSKQDQLLLTWILSSLTEEVYSYVNGCKSSFDAWRELESAFGSVSQNR